MPASLKASTYLVDGTDLQASGVQLTHAGAGLWTGLAEDVATLVTPGTDGGGITGGAFPMYTHSTMFLIRGIGFDDTWAKIVALRRRCKPGRTVTLTRQMPDPEGTPANVNLTTTGRRLTDRPDWLESDGTAAALDIDWLIADPPWHGASVHIATGAGAHTIVGDTRTRRITLTLDAGPARTIANYTNGYGVQFLATVPTGGVAIDVEARTAHAVTGGADMSSALNWSKQFPFQLEPGSNNLVTDAGTFSLDYQPAYL